MEIEEHQVGRCIGDEGGTSLSPVDPLPSPCSTSTCSGPPTFETEARLDLFESEELEDLPGNDPLEEDKSTASV